MQLKQGKTETNPYRKWGASLIHQMVKTNIQISEMRQGVTENEIKRDKSGDPKVQIDQSWVIPLERNRLVRNELQTPSTLKYLSETFTPGTSLQPSSEYAHPLSRSPPLFLSDLPFFFFSFFLSFSFPSRTPYFCLPWQATTRSPIHRSTSMSSSTTAMAGHASLPHIPCGCFHAWGGPPLPTSKKWLNSTPGWFMKGPIVSTCKNKKVIIK